jgi:hypothetical protein
MNKNDRQDRLLKRLLLIHLIWDFPAAVSQLYRRFESLTHPAHCRYWPQLK